MSATNETTKQILKYLFEHRIFAWRQNTGGIPLPTGGFRPAAKTGVSDILAVLPGGRLLCIEIKNGRDKLRPEQIGFLKNITDAGGLSMVVKDYQDFVDKISKLS